MNKIIVVEITAIMLFTFSSQSSASWLQDQWNTIKTTNIQTVKTTSLSQTKVADGLREALKVGINNAVNATGKTDGFFKNDAIKIPIPQNLQLLERGMRTLGFNKPVDDFVLSMNRAAEAAAPKARDIFINTILSLSFDDVMKIYNGGNTSATDFLKARSSPELRAAFSPIVKKSLGQYDVSNKYNSLITQYRALPFSKKMPVPDLDQYVLDKALDGLFQVLGQEETKIRTQPAARITDLLKEVFK